MYKKDRFYYIFCYCIVIFLTLIVLYPMIFIVSASLSSTEAVGSGRVWLLPVEVSLEAYKTVFEYEKIWIGYRNTLLYTIAGTLINVVLTMMCAFPLARKNLRGRKIFLKLFAFTMLFSGGIIPAYILVKQLNMMNTIWAVLIPSAMNVYNMIVARTFIENNITTELHEATKIDGCDDFKFFIQMVLPLSKAVIAVLAVWYAVAHWNSYFDSFLYLSDANMYPLQLFLREILIADQMIQAERMEAFKELLKYAVIVVSSAPLLCVYPFAQKYFTKGVMIGSVKG